MSDHSTGLGRLALLAVAVLLACVAIGAIAAWVALA